MVTVTDYEFTKVCDQDGFVDLAKSLTIDIFYCLTGDYKDMIQDLKDWKLWQYKALSVH